MQTGQTRALQIASLQRRLSQIQGPDEELDYQLGELRYPEIDETSVAGLMSTGRARPGCRVPGGWAPPGGDEWDFIPLIRHSALLHEALELVDTTLCGWAWAISRQHDESGPWYACSLQFNFGKRASFTMRHCTPELAIIASWLKVQEWHYKLTGV